MKELVNMTPKKCNCGIKDLACFFVVFMCVLVFCHACINMLFGDKDNTFWAAATAIGTLTAAVFAKCAYEESLKARKSNTFQSMFTTLISEQMKFFDAVPENKKLFFQRKNAFKDFVDYLTSRQKLIVELHSRTGIEGIWDDYCNKLAEPAKFIRCFKYVYNEIDTIIKNNPDHDCDLYYSNLIQAGMTKDELFCYLINFLVSAKVDNKDEHKRIQDFMKKNDFFKDLCREAIGTQDYARHKYIELVIEMYNDATGIKDVIDDALLH